MTDLEKCPHCGGSLKQRSTRKTYCSACDEVSCEVTGASKDGFATKDTKHTCTKCRAVYDLPGCFGHFMEPDQTWTESKGDCSQYCPHRVECHWATSGDTRDH